MAKTNQKLARIYYSPANPGSLGGAEKLYRQAKHLNITRPEVKKFLKQQRAYTLHKPARRRYARLKTIVSGPNKQWQADLVDMSSMARSNGGFRFLLTAIDCFSRYAWAVPVKRKDGPSMALVLDTLLSGLKHKPPTVLQTDKGTEFFNSRVKAVLQKHGITNHFATHSDTKAAMVERFNRTLKQKMWTYFTAKSTNRWLDVLPNLMSAYNNSFHRVIKQTPAALHTAPEHVIDKSWGGQFGKYLAAAQPSTQINSKVRISKQKTTFEKGYLPNWTQELFTVKQARAGPGRRVYKLEDEMQEPITGVFYPEEIQPVEKSHSNKQYQVEKILRKKLNKTTGKTLWLVKWYGWPPKFNSWINAKKLKPKHGK